MVGVAKYDKEKEVEARRKVHKRSGEAGDRLCCGRPESVVHVARPEGKHFPNASDGMAV